MNNYTLRQLIQAVDQDIKRAVEKCQDENDQLKTLLAAYRAALKRGQYVYDYGEGKTIFCPVWASKLSDADLDAAVLAAGGGDE